jgi:SMI1 / KNR4 family (SUKH-1)
VSIETIAEGLLNRPLTPRDGCSEATIKLVEKRLGFTLPNALREFYLCVGKNSAFSQAFSRFVSPQALEIDNNKVVFLAENQEVCLWAFDTQDRAKHPTVYQTQSGGEFFIEDVTIEEFIRINLYYQLAQGGYPHCATIQVEETQALNKVFNHLGSNADW